MDYKQFEKVMNEIKEVDDFENDLASFCHKFNTNNKLGAEAEFRFPDLSATVVHLLEQIFNDKGEWISYFIWELNYGESYEPGMILDADGSAIKLANYKDLYEFLIDNMLN